MIGEGRHRSGESGDLVREDSASDLWAFLYACRTCHRPHIPRLMGGTRGKGITYSHPLDQHPYVPRVPGSLLDDLMREWLMATGDRPVREPLATAMRIELDRD